MKQEFPQKEFLFLCKKITENQYGNTNNSRSKESS